MFSKNGGRPTFACRICRGDIAVNIFSADSTCFQECLVGNFTLCLPEYKCLETPGQTKYELWYFNKNGVTPTVTYELGKNRVVVEGPGDFIYGGQALPFIAYSLIELQGMYLGQVTAHCAVVSINNKAILLFGKAGSGKTTVALELCIKHNAKLISNDISILAMPDTELFVLGGTKQIYARVESLTRTHPEVLAYSNQVYRGDGWQVRASMSPEKIGIQTASGAVNVVKAFSVLLPANDNGDFQVGPVGKHWGKLYLHENFGRYIRATALPIIGGNSDYFAYPPSLDTPELFTKRLRIIEHLTQPNMWDNVFGNHKMVARHIAMSLQ